MLDSYRTADRPGGGTGAYVDQASVGLQIQALGIKWRRLREASTAKCAIEHPIASETHQHALLPFPVCRGEVVDILASDEQLAVGLDHQCLCVGRDEIRAARTAGSVGLNREFAIHPKGWIEFTRSGHAQRSCQKPRYPAA